MMGERWKWASVKQIKAAADELKATIRATFPDAEFDLTRAPDDPYMWILWTRVAMDSSEDDSEAVRSLVLERTMDMLEEDHIPIQVIPIRGPDYVFDHHVEAEKKAGRRKTSATALSASALP
ncbi:MAG TPA: hypothetical protein VFH48_42210 [Chloroflexota bacterium]|nr:hypothetical protein [Chloroflexota bacterium]